jgi:serine protease Do
LGIGTDLVRFFARTNADYLSDAGQYAPRSLNEFIQEHPEHIMADMWPITLRLALQGHLHFAGAANESPLSQPWLNYRFFSQPFLEADIIYGTFDFAALGFPYIRDYFKHSVKAINVVKDDGRPDNGSGFLLEDRRFVTARHCIEKKREIHIDGWDAVNAPLKNIWVFKDTRFSPRSEVDKRPDLALLEFAGEPFPGIPGFQLQEAQILDDVLTMGCPTVPGFDQMFITETAQIAAELKSTVGHVVAQERAYLGNLTYLLISARVKGGNSGGPVIGREGKVVGVVAQLPAEAEGRLDVLGYGVVVPTPTLKQLLQATNNNSDQAEQLSFKQKDGIITTTSTIAPIN